jgi:hypothetical protein
MKALVFTLAIAVLFASCTKEALNEKRLGGVWVAQEVKYIFYENNQPVRDSVVQNSGELYLWDDDELGNQARNSLAITPSGFSYTWEGDAGDPHTLMGTTIQELTRKKLVLTEAVSDTSLTVYRVIEYSFKR